MCGFCRARAFVYVLCQNTENGCCGVFGTEAVLRWWEGDVGSHFGKDQPLKNFKRVAKWWYWFVRRWLCRWFSRGLSCLVSRCWTVLWWMENLKMSVRILMAIETKYFSWLYEMPSGPTADAGVVCSIAFWVMFGMKGGEGHWLFSCRWGCVVVWKWRREVFLSRFDCSLEEVIGFLLVAMPSCVSGVSVSVLLRSRMTLQS